MPLVVLSLIAFDPVMSRLSPFDSRTHLKVEELAAVYHLERLNQPHVLYAAAKRLRIKARFLITCRGISKCLALSYVYHYVF